MGAIPGRVAPGARAQGSGGAAAPGEPLRSAFPAGTPRRPRRTSVPSCRRPAAGDLRPVSRRVLRGAAASVIVLVALARILLRVHWPSDVPGGIAHGLGCVAAAAALTAASTARRPAAPTSP